jgi:hypothetical protein
MARRLGLLETGAEELGAGLAQVGILLEVHTLLATRSLITLAEVDEPPWTRMSRGS